MMHAYWRDEYFQSPLTKMPLPTGSSDEPKVGFLDAGLIQQWGFVAGSRDSRRLRYVRRHSL